MLNEQVESVMAKAMMLVGALDDSCEEATSLPFLEAVTALRAEVERLAAQSAPTLLDAFKSGNVILIDWPMEPVTPQEALKLMDMMDAEYVKTMGKLAPDREMAVSMQRVRHMACALWASQKEVMRSHFVELAAAQSAQAPAQAVQEARCACNDRPASECPGEWEPGCDLGNNPKYVRAYVDAGRTIPPSGEIGGA